MRRMSGIWPPSKPGRMLLPERAVWPLPPRPLVLPWPPPSPQPTRFLRCTAPGTFFNSWSFMDGSSEGGAPSPIGGTELGSYVQRVIRWFVHHTSNIIHQTCMMYDGQTVH